MSFKHTIQLEVAQACPTVQSYAEQARTQRALAWKAGIAEFRLTMVVTEPIQDLQTQRVMKACSLTVGKAIGSGLLGDAGPENGIAVTEGMNRCLAQPGLGATIRVSSATVKRESVECR
jgi:hypothetical protein